MLKPATLALWALSGVHGLNMGLRIGSGGRTVHDFEREMEANPEGLDKRGLLFTRDVDPETLYPKRYFTMPVDHFPNQAKYEPHTDRTYQNRYWFDDTYYKPGGPIILLQSGETNGLNRLPFMQKGILAQLANATGGISVILEHRYYGYSFPTHFITTKDYRFLTTDQALADVAYFAQNVVFSGYEDVNLTSHETAWISYGGSYAGATSAFTRVKYPDVFWGAISSSGVTKAIWDFWEYYEPVSKYGPADAMAAQKLFVDMVDNIVIDKAGNTELVQTLKEAFGMPNVTHIPDFTNQLAQGVGWWQSLNWDPEVSYPDFYLYCDNITSTDILYPATESKRSTAKMLLREGGYTPNKTITNQLLNYIGWINLTAVAPCTAEGITQDQCFSNLNATQYQGITQKNSVIRSWAYQYCTEWGYLQTGSGVPKDQMPVISRTIDLNYTSFICRAAFDLDQPADVEEVNKYGAYEIKHSRLAFVDGAWDPWRPATPHAYEQGAPHRVSTTSEPFILIPKALHHYDENGRFANETTAKLPPPSVVKAQAEEREFVMAWVDEWNAAKKR